MNSSRLSCSLFTLAPSLERILAPVARIRRNGSDRPAFDGTGGDCGLISAGITEKIR